MGKLTFLPHYNSKTNRNKSNVLIVADSKVNKDFVNELCDKLNTNADLLYIDTSRSTRASVVRRHLSYFILGIKALSMGHNYNHIIFWQQFIGLYWSSLIFLKRSSSSSAILLPLIYKARKGVLGTAYRSFFSFSLSSQALTAAVCHSSEELKYYKKTFPKSRDKIFFIHYGQSSETKDPGRFPAERFDYFFSGGTSNRDYKSVASVAKKKNYNFIFACTHNDIRLVNIPKNIRILYDAYGDKFNALIRSARAVVLTLENPHISSGQIVLLKSMAMKKPIVATKSAGTLDYVDDTCAYLIEPHNEEQLQVALTHIIENPQEAEIFAAKANKRYREKYSIQQFASSIADLITNHEEAGMTS